MKTKEEQTLTPAQAAKLISVHPETLRRYETKGLIESFRTAGGHRRYQETNILALRKRLAESNLNPVRDEREKLVLSALEGLGISGHTALKTVKEAFPSAYGGLAECFIAPVEIQNNKFLLICEIVNNQVLFQRFSLEGWPINFKAFKAILRIQELSGALIKSEIKDEKDLREMPSQQRRARIPILTMITLSLLAFALNLFAMIMVALFQMEVFELTVYPLIALLFSNVMIIVSSKINIFEKEGREELMELYKLIPKFFSESREMLRVYWESFKHLLKYRTKQDSQIQLLSLDNFIGREFSPREINIAD